MTTSGVVTGTLTARSIINKAYTLIGVKGSVTELSSEDADEGLDTLSWMLKSWQADGIQLWRSEAVTMTWPADTQTGALDPSVLDVLSLRWTLNGNETPMRRYSNEEWNRIPNKANPGTPMLWNFVKLTNSVQLRVWPIPTEDTAFVGEVLRIIETVTDIDETIDVPQEWTETVFYNLAARLADVSGRTGERVNRVLARSADLYTRLRGFDREPVLRIRPAARYGWG